MTKKMLSVLLLLIVFSSVGLAQNDGRTTYAIFPQLATGVFSDGSSYRTTFLVFNPSTTLSSSCTLAAYSGGRGSSAPVTMPPGFWDVEPFGTGTDPFLSGYATIVCTRPINSSLVYSFYSPSGVKIGEATVLPAAPARIVGLIADQRDGARIGIAIANDLTAEQSISVGVYDNSYTKLASAGFQLGPKNTKLGFVDELTGWSGVRANVWVSCPTACSAVGLRFTGAVFSTVPFSVILP